MDYFVDEMCVKAVDCTGTELQEFEESALAVGFRKVLVENEVWYQGSFNKLLSLYDMDIIVPQIIVSEINDEGVLEEMPSKEVRRILLDLRDTF